MINNCTFTGRLATDIKTFNNGGRFTLAVQQNFKNKNTGKYEADFVPVVMFGKVADAVGKFFDKGNLIGITGQFQNNHHQDKSGNMQYSEQIVLNGFTFIDSGKNDNNQSNHDDVDDSGSNEKDPFAGQSDDFDVSDDDLPF